MLNIIFSTLPFFVSLCWLTVFIIDYRRHGREKKIFAYFLLTCTLLYLAHATFFLNERKAFYLLESIYAYCNLAVYPLSFLYIKALTDPRPLRPRDFAMMATPVAIFIWSIVCYLFMGKEGASFMNYAFFGEGPRPGMTLPVKLQFLRLGVSRVIFALQIYVVVVYGSRHLNRFKDQVSDFYSNVDGRDLRSIRIFIKVLWGFAIVSFIMNIAGRQFFARTQGLLIVSSIIASALLYGLCYAVRREHFCADRFTEDISGQSVPQAADASLPASAPEPDGGDLPERAAAQDAASSPSGAKNLSGTDHYARIGPALDALMQSREVFRNDDLLITDVAKMIGSNRTYVSTYLNKERGLSFSDYINGWRIEYAKHLLESDPKMALADISQSSGFSSEATFYRVFKRFTGKTPNGYRSPHA